MVTALVIATATLTPGTAGLHPSASISSRVRHFLMDAGLPYRLGPLGFEFLANIVRLYRGEDVETVDGSTELLDENFPDGKYVDVPGLCKVASRADIEAQGWSLNPGRYTGTAVVEENDEDFHAKLQELYEEFTLLSDEAEALRTKVDAAVQGVLGS